MAGSDESVLVIETSADVATVVSSEVESFAAVGSVVPLDVEALFVNVVPDAVPEGTVTAITTETLAPADTVPKAQLTTPAASEHEPVDGIEET